MPEPLHPAVVHFPIVLAMLSPIAIAAVLWAIRARRIRARAWLGVVVLQAVVLTTGWLAAEAGEREEERVERVVAEERIEAHEEAAERFLLVAGIGLALAGAGLLGGRVGSATRGLTLAASLAAVAAVASAGHSGGELVYRHGAALAYVQATPDVAAAGALGHVAAIGEEDDDD